MGSTPADGDEPGDVFGRMVNQHLENGVPGTAKPGTARPGSEPRKGADATDGSTAAGAVLASLAAPPVPAGAAADDAARTAAGTTAGAAAGATAGAAAAAGRAAPAGPRRTDLPAGSTGVSPAAKASTAGGTTAATAATATPSATTGAAASTDARATSSSTSTAATGPTAAADVTPPAHAEGRHGDADHPGTKAGLPWQAGLTASSATSTRTDARTHDGSGSHAGDPAATTAAGTGATTDTTSANAVSSVAPAGAAAGATSANGTSTGPAATVVDQVLTTIPRMVQRGDGTSRLILKLHPADLGEVHVTVTVKGGAVDVSLAADARAREALGAGSDRLRGLLESLGHTSGQVVVRELPGGPGAATGSGQLGGQTGNQPGGSWTQSWGQGAGQPHGQPGTSADLSGFAGRDGRQPDPGTALSGREGTTSGPTATQSRTTHRRVHAGASGLDVTV